MLTITRVFLRGYLKQKEKDSMAVFGHGIISVSFGLTLLRLRIDSRQIAGHLRIEVEDVGEVK